MQEREDLSFEVLDRPVPALGLDLVKRANRRGLDLHQRSVVRPAQQGRESVEWCGVELPERSATSLVANLPGSGRACAPLGFATSDVANLGTAVTVRDVEGPEVPQVGCRVASADPFLKMLRQLLDDLLAVLGAGLPALHVLDDLAADVPVRQHHLAVDGADDASARLLDDRHYALDERGEIARPCERRRLSPRRGNNRVRLSRRLFHRRWHLLRPDLRWLLARRLGHRAPVFAAAGRVSGCATRGSAGGGSRRDW
jgi:hypothetical protein